MLVSLAPACGKETSTPRQSGASGGAPEAGAAGERGGDEGIGGASPFGGAAAGDGGAGSPSSAAGAPPRDGGGSSGGGAADSGGQGGVGTPVEPSLELSAITISQSLQVALMQAGVEVPLEERSAPLLAGKRALMRAFVELGADAVGRELIGVLDLEGPGGNDTLIDRRTFSTSSLPEDLATTFQFEVEARDLAVTTRYRIRVLAQDTSLLARFPATGLLPLGAAPERSFQLVLVPMIANGVSPPLPQPLLDRLRQRLLQVYPVSDVSLGIAEPLTVDGPLHPNDDDAWQSALDALLEARALAKPPAAAFYYGMLTPSASYDSYCQDGCYLGLSYVGNTHSAGDRGAVGLTVFPDGSGEEDAWDTLTHELGHTLGRLHAPCDVTEDLDRRFPYSDGRLGTTYGFDATVGQLLRPRDYGDLMGYCTPVWVSDYTYRGLFDALSAVDPQPALRVLAPVAPERLRVARIGRSGVTRWQRDRFGAMGGELEAVPLRDASGRDVGVVQVRFRRLDHAPGGSVWLRAAELAVSGAVWVDLRPLGGKLLAL